MAKASDKLNILRQKFEAEKANLKKAEVLLKKRSANEANTRLLASYIKTIKARMDSLRKDYAHFSSYSGMRKVQTPNPSYFQVGSNARKPIITPSVEIDPAVKKRAEDIVHENVKNYPKSGTHYAKSSLSATTSDSSSNFDSSTPGFLLDPFVMNNPAGKIKGNGKSNHLGSKRHRREIKRGQR